MSTRWFNISESLDGGPDLDYIERENLDRAVTNISFIQGGWITVPSQSDMYNTPFEKLFNGQIFNVLSTGEQFIAKRFQVGINGWTDVFNNSHSFALHTWNSSSHALSASHIIGGGTGTGFPYDGSDNQFGDPAQAIITGSLLVSGSGNITASNLQIDNNINLDGTLSFDGFTFSDGNILVTSGSTTFGDSASQDTHTFTGSLYVSGGIYLASGGNGDIKLHGTSSYALTASHIIGGDFTSPFTKEGISGSWQGQSLLSSSYQIKDDISGSWKTNQFLLSSSYQIKDDISGSWQGQSLLSSS